MKMKNLIAYAALAFGVIAAPFAGHADPGDIYEIYPVEGSRLQPTDTLKPNDTLTFVVRLLSRNFNVPNPRGWSLKHIGPNDPTWDYNNNPLKLGIVVSGRLELADIKSVMQLAAPMEAYTDITCTYKVKPGDLALPVRLALKGSTKYAPIIAGTTDESIDTAYYLENDRFWAIANDDGDVGVLTYCTEERAVQAAGLFPTGTDRRVDYDLTAYGRFYLQGIRFAEPWDSDTTWRSVKEGGTETSNTPKIETIGLPTDTGKFYVWSEDETSVKIPEARGRKVHMKLPPDGATEGDRWVYEISLTAETQYPFPIEGVAKDTTTQLVLSPVDHYVYNDAGTLCADYLTVPVACTEPPKPYVSVTVDGARSVTKTPAVGAAYNTDANVTAVQVKLGGTLPDHDVTVTLKPSIPSQPGKAWTDYIGLSKFNNGGAHDGTLTVTLNKEKPSETLYLYALGSDGDTTGPSAEKAIRLEAEVDEASRPFYTGTFEYATVYLMRTNPVIVQPAFGEEFPDIQGGTTYNFKLKVDDTYKNAAVAAPAAGYVIYAKTGNTGSTEKKITCPTTADGTWHLDAEGALVENDGFLPIAYDTAGTYYTEIRLVAPDGQKSKYTGGTDVAPVKVKVTVSKPKTVEAVVTSKTWKEGSIVPVNFKIGPTAHSETIYAFLKPKTDAMAALVDGTLVIKNGQASDGVEIAQGDTESLDPRALRLLDGKSPDLMGTSLQFDIVLWKNSEYNETETEYAVEGFSVAKKLQLTVNNEQPKVSKVERTGGGSVQWKSPSDTPTMNVTVAKGVPQKFTLADMSKNEPGVLDLPTMNMKWKFEEYNEAGSFVLGGEQELEGTPALKPWEHTFKTAGYTLITVQLRDKDMKEYPGEYGDEYTFRVNVTGDPSVTVAENGLTFNEADSTGRITVRMSQGANDPIDVKVTVTPYEASADPGRFVLDQTKLIDPAVKNEYKLTFTPGTSTAMENFLTFSDLDGTLGSQQKGFRIALTVLTKTLNPDGKPYDEYYHTEDARIYVVNEKPSVIAPASNGPLEGDDKGYKADIGANESRAITFTVASDVSADVTAGFKVTFICTGGGGTLDGAPYTGPVTIPDLGSHTFVPNFSSQGAQQITLRIEDKDTNAGTEVFERTWYYDVQAAKTLRLVPHGPTGGFTTSAQSQRYADYAAMGHVWADRANPSMKGFNLSYNCGTAKSVDIYAYGYKLASPVDDGTLDGGKDVAIGANGDSTEIGPYFTYVSADGKDSFFYRWILIQGGGEDASVGSIAPEHPKSSATAQGSVTLPAELGDDGAYDETVVEAVFGYEYLWSDNMGDINQDGIPDVAVVRAWKNSFGGIFDPASGAIASGANDLSKLSGFNDDGVTTALGGTTDQKGDYIPALETSVNGTLIPGLRGSWVTLGRAFDAKMELRGYHDGLNDAFAAKTVDGLANPCSVNGVQPERVYQMPDGSYDAEKCTISELEYLAWKDTGLTDFTQWSPERPTDPTTDDTDEDGVPDGYEYYFWYQAHVGYMENGEHKYMTGRRYNPAHPCEPDLITPAEIEASMDPIKAGDKATANTRDTDNDGLPDVLEFEIGTNPFDFDTDGDGLPDGYEIIYHGVELDSSTLSASGVSVSQNTDTTVLNPLVAATGGGVRDSLRNPDGDAMAYEYVENRFSVYGLLTDEGKLVYRAVEKHAEGHEGYMPVTVSLADGAARTGWKLLRVSGTATNAYFTTTDLSGKWREETVAGETKYVLCTDLTKDSTWVLRGKEKDTLGLPAYLSRGTAFAKEPEADFEAKTQKLAIFRDDGSEVGDDWFRLKDGVPPNRFYSAFRYGLPEFDQTAEKPGYGRFTVCGDAEVKGSWPVVFVYEDAVEKSPVYLIHHASYQMNGFDPRAGWDTSKAKTRAFTTYDEFLALSFHLHANARGTATGLLEDSIDGYLPTRTRPWTMIWQELCTDPFNADSDKDGLPDGWELYVMAGPKVKLPKPDDKIPVLASPHPTSSYGPLAPYGNVGDKNAPDSDGLNFAEEFFGVESGKLYSDYDSGSYCETVARSYSDWLNKTGKGWRNKKMPTDPWNADTDGDGITDGDEGKAFIYGDPEAEGVPGGGLNPLSWDTDGDGLPDPWEQEFGADGHFVEGAVASTNATGTAAKGLWCLKDKDAQGRDVPTVDGTVKDSNADYDHDGLLNWQEYMVGSMRCWRYDDTFSSWSVQHFNEMELMAADGRYWFERLVCIPAKSASAPLGPPEQGVITENPAEGSFEYNPRLVNGLFDSGATYFSLCTNEWDSASGNWYMFRDGVYHDLKNPGPEWSIEPMPNQKVQYNRFTWWVMRRDPGMPPFPFVYWQLPGDKDIFIYPERYICCNPNKYDTDNDGMDDYYELFHGLNPLLGKPNGYDNGHNPAVDIVFEAYGGGRTVTADTGELVAIWSADNNFWLNGVASQNDSDTGAKLVRDPVDTSSKTGAKCDFVAYPWLNGMADADPDGDNIPNQEEAIMPNLQSSSSWHHTDPTPLWMTDFSYAKSLTSRYYRPVSALGWKDIPADFPYFDFDWNGDGAIDYKTERWDIRSFPGYSWTDKKGISVIPYTLHEAFGPNETIFSFEENEGFDSDHDYLSDFEESQGKTKSASDPQLSDDPLRRQAMWFDGVGSFLQTPLEESEYWPVDDLPVPQELPFLYFTVECWARPDDACDLAKAQTIVERAIWNSQSNPGDMKYLRKNFLLGIRNGRWYAKYDSSGTDANQPVEITEGPVAEKKWTHLAASYDGTALRLYVDGICNVTHDSSVAPEHGTWTVTTDETGNLRDGKTTHPYVSLLVGASAKTRIGIMFDSKYRGESLEGTTRGDYQDFYNGYVDEVRIWDGARNESQILADYKKRYSQADCADNRQTCLNAWLQGATFDASSGIRRPAELRYHFSFDHIPGASDAKWVIKAPAGFLTDESIADAKARHWSRPDDWTCPWWNMTDGSIKSTVYDEFSWVPWIGNTVAHLPRPDGTTLDSFYWSADFAGDLAAAVSNETRKFAFPMTAESVSKWRQMSYVTQNRPPNTTPTRYELVKGIHDELGPDEVGTAEDPLSLYSFTLRYRTRAGADLLPFGGAFAKRISSAEGGMWDEKGSADAWAETGLDADNNGLPDWWETYCRKHYLGKDFPRWEPVGWDTTVTYDGVLMPAWQAYLRDLAKGMQPDQKYHDEYADAMRRDMDDDGLPDWWEEIYGVQNFTKADADVDPDRDGLSNYAEYLLSVEYPKAYPAITNAVGDVVALNPRQAHTAVGQLVTDYFLRYSDKPIVVANASGESHFLLNEYFGEIATDHDFMEDWWESQYGNSYVTPRKYDPLDDRDEDGWSNWAECRSWFWCGGDQADAVSRWTTTDESLDTRVANSPAPAISLRLTYHGEFKDRDLVAPVVVRTLTSSDRADATFIVTPDREPSVDKGLAIKYVGAVNEELPIHGFLNPGNVDVNSVFLQRALCSTERVYSWSWDWYDSNNIPHPDIESGNFATFVKYAGRYPFIALESSQLIWSTAAVSSSDKNEQKVILSSLRDGRQIGTVDARSGEYEIDIPTFFETDGDDSANQISVFRVVYATRMPYSFPKTVTVQDTRELPMTTKDGLYEDAPYRGYGRVKEGRNTIEVFVDRNGNGTPDDGEPFGSVRNVAVGWHKVPTVAVELRDTPSTMPCVALGGGADAGDGGNEEEVALTKTVRITRRLINGMNWNEGKRLTERPLLTKKVVVADHPYLTEADVLNVAKPDLDWTWLMRDARKFGIEDVNSVTYSVDEVRKLEDGSTTNVLIAPIVKVFSSTRSLATALSPIENEPVYSASPKLSFSATDDNATGYRLQIRKRGETSVLYDSGYRVLPGRTGSTVGKPAYEIVPPVFADMDVVAGLATNRQVFADGANYQWRVALVNAKFNTAEEADYCNWADFQMDVRNRNRYPKLPTGYGNVAVAVRYYGPTNCAPADVIVEAFANADFSGQPLAQVRLGGTADLLRATDDVTSTNAVLRGIDPGKAFFRAYFDQNGNGIRDSWETWGYANMVGTSFKALFNPLDYTVEEAFAERQAGRCDVVIYMEDCDVNKNEWPDCIDPFGDFTADTPYWIESEQGSDSGADSLADNDGDGMPDVWENWNDGITDPLVTDGDFVPEDEIDVMAYREETRYLVTIADGSEEGLTLLFADGEYEKYKSQDGEKAAEYAYTTYYLYGPAVENAQIYGVGTNVTLSAGDWWIKGEPVPVTVALVHAQVYAKKGFSMLTANPKAYAEGRAVDTKPFTALDRYLVMRYLEAIGATPGYPSKYKSFEEYALNAGSEVWKNWTLLPGRADANGDTIDDGWELYVMYGDALADTVPAASRRVALATPTISPWGSIGATTAVAPDGSCLTWRQEYDGGRYPTDPWNEYTIGDRYPIDGVEYVISDKDAYAYHLKHFPGEEGDKFADFDNDGLANYDEYVIQKNNNRTLDADKMFSYFGSVTIPSLAGQCVPDYFLKSTKRNAAASDLAGKAVYDYLGFDYTSHDFMETWWKDQYTALLPDGKKYVDRTRFEPYDDPDNDGWSNWAEDRAGTDPTRVAMLGIENMSISEYPVPLINLTVTHSDVSVGDAQIIASAYSQTGDMSKPDAIWSSTFESTQDTAEEAEGSEGLEKTAARYVGVWQANPVSANLAPGSVTPGSIAIMFKDMTFDNSGAGDYNLVLDEVAATEPIWVKLIGDQADENDPAVGKLFERSTGTYCGSINYETGRITLELGNMVENVALNHTSGEGKGWDYQQTMHPHKAYVKIEYMSSVPEQTLPAKFYLSDANDASSISGGHVREGMNTFTAFADLNNNSVYDPGEPFGMVRNIDVGWQEIKGLTISLSSTSPVLPRFKPYDYAAAAASNELENADVEFEYEVELPVITDRPDLNYVKIVREYVNGIEVQPVTVFEKEIDAASVITEADILRKGVYDLDWQTLAADAELYSAEGFPALDEIDTVSYVVYVGSDNEVEAHRVGTIKKKFAPKRAKATPVAPYASHAESIVSETRPTFRWTLDREGYTAFAFQMLTNGVPVYETVIPAPAKNAAGEYAFQPDLWFGEVADTNAHLFTNGKYSWRVAPMNAKFCTVPAAAGDSGSTEWSETAEFTVELAKGKVHDTDKGILEVAVRYYGVATVSEDHPIVVQAFRTADFTGIPAGETVITNVELLASYDNVTNANARFLGLPAGDYYVRAFVDTTNDFVRSAWESWGYRNNVGTDKADLYTPVATAVGRNVTGTALVIMEDMDCDLSKVPDCIEGFRVDPDFGIDTDGDGMPDWWEEKYGFDPLDPSDADEDLDDDGLTNLEEYRHHTLPDFWDTDGDFMPDGVEVTVIGSNPLRPDATAAAKYDVMAKAVLGDVQIYAVTNVNGKVIARYAVRAGENDLAESTETNRVYTTFTVPFDDNLYIGAPTNFDRSAAAYVTVATNAVAIHGAVYDWYGFNNSTAWAAGGSNTVAFTAWDKYVTAAYYLPEFGVTNCTTLRVGIIDGNANGLPDGWELYVGFATDTREENPNLASPTFPLTGEAYRTALVEFDRAHDVADPWNKFYIFEQIHGSAKEAYKQNLRPYTNLEARHYLLVDGDTAIDTDGDGLSNYQEYLAKQDLGLWLCVTNVFTDGATPDYFRATAAKSVYAGEQYNGAEWIEAEGRDALGMIEDGLKRAGTRNYDNSGWDYWSVVRNGFDSEYAGVNDTDLTFVLRYIDAVMPGECSAKTLPELREFVHTQWAGVKRTAWNYTWDYDYSYSYTYDPETGTYSYERGDNNDDDTDTRMELEGDKLVTLDEMISFFGGREKMQTTIDSNKQALALDEITLPEPKVDLIVRYTGDKKYVLLVDAYQWNPTHPAAGVQRTAFWNTSAEFNAGVAKVPLATPNAGTLKQGAALFIAYIDQNGNGKFDSADTFGTARMEIGFAGGELEIALGDCNPALPYVDLNASAAGSNAVASAQCGLWVVRTGVNGVKFTGSDEKYAKAVYYRTLYNNVERGIVYPTEWIGEDFIGVDRYFNDAEGIAKELGDGHVDSVDYAILVGHGPFTNWTVAVAHEFTVNYDVKRSFAKNLHFTDATEEALTLSFEVPTDHPYTKYWMKVVDTVNETTNYYGGTRGFLLPNTAPRSEGAAGTVTVDPLRDCGAILSEGEYEFSFALGNDKFGAPVEEDFGKPLALSVNAKRATDAKFLVTVKHPTADLTGGRMTVAAYESEDLANPVAVVTNADCAEAIELAGLRSEKKYYLAAWYVVDAEDGRPSAAVRAPYDTWGYVCAFDQSEACFTPLAIEATKAGTPVMVWLQDTDWNDNGRLDREESMTTGITYPYVTGVSPYDPSGVIPFPPVTPIEPPAPTPPGPPVPPMPPIPPFPPVTPSEDDDDARWAYGDVMAYADIPDVLLVKIGTSAEDAAWYAVMDLEGEGVKIRDEDIALQTPAADIGSLMTTWNMSPDEVRYLDPTVDRETLVGVGRAAAFTGTNAKVLDKRSATVRLVHAQVYAKFGFETGCAAIRVFNRDPGLEDGIASAEHSHTKAFTNWDKFLVVRYLQAIGVAGVDEEALLEDPTNPIWSLFLNDCIDSYKFDVESLRNRRDSDRDDVADGWEFYVMFGQEGLKAFTTVPGASRVVALAAAKISPFNVADGLKLTAPTWGDPSDPRTAEGGLLLVEEFDGGYYPTDPWQIDTHANGETRGDGVIDYYAYQYHLKGNDAWKDFDGDELSNYAEYLAKEVFRFASDDPSYFDKVGDLYLGEIFTDHDQVDNAWEHEFSAGANMYVYDPFRDDDNDGWSNWAESKVGSDPTKVTKLGVDGYTKNEYPVPVIEAKVVYNGNDVNLGSIVFKAWNDADDPDMNSAPDAIWTIGNGEAKSGGDTDGAGAPSTETASTAEDHVKYVGRRPNGVQRYALGGGTVVSGTVRVSLYDPDFVNLSSSNATEAADARWYVDVTDKNGVLYDYLSKPVGTVDYDTGVMTLDCSQLTGSATARRNSSDASPKKLIVDTATSDGSGGDSYFTILRDNAYLRISWQSQLVGITPNGTYMLGDADAVAETAKSHGHVREGLNTFICFADTINANGEYDPGEPFGVVRGVDVGWQGAKFTVELTETSAITPRMKLWEDGNDRDTTIDGTLNALLNDRTIGNQFVLARDATNAEEQAAIVASIKQALSNRVQHVLAQKDKVRVRVVRYGIDDMFAYMAGVYTSGLGKGFEQRVVMDKEFDRSGRDYVNEADFLGPDAFDIDWGTMDGEIVDASGNPISGAKRAGLNITNMTYLVVIGDGAQDFRGSGDTNTVVYAAGAVARRFESKKSRPVVENVEAICYGARPTFRWSIPTEEPFAKRFGTSYTAFKLQVWSADGVTKIYDSGVRRAPTQDRDGVFSWTADLSAGDLTKEVKIFNTPGNYMWSVAMYNAKFQPVSDAADMFAEKGRFSIAANTQQEMNDFQYSSIDVAVKYAGPANVIAQYADLSTLKGKVRVQAFATADFAGEPLSETVVTEKVDDFTSATANVRLVGLEATGTYYIRAYIDSDGDHTRSEWESWGAAKTPVVLSTSLRTAPLVGVWIEDCDVDQDWLPDAGESVKFGTIAEKTANVKSDSKTIFTTDMAAATKMRLASLSTGLEGASLTIFENGAWAKTLLGWGDDKGDITFDDIRAAVQGELDVKSGTFKITSLTLGPDGKVTLTVDAEVAPTIAGTLLSTVYDVKPGTKKKVKLQVYRKTSLAMAGWGKPVKTVSVELGAGEKEISGIDVGVTAEDLKSGFYKIDIVE